MNQSDKIIAHTPEKTQDNLRIVPQPDPRQSAPKVARAWLKNLQLTPAAYNFGMVLAGSASYATPDDARRKVRVGELFCFPEQATIAAKMKMSVRQVQRFVKALRESGFLEVRQRVRPYGASYVFSPPNVASGVASGVGSGVGSQREFVREKKERVKQQHKRVPVRVSESHENQTAAAATHISTNTSKSEDERHTCPKCERTWPKQFGAVCYGCQCDVERAQARAQYAEEHLAEIDAEEAAERISEEAKPPPKPTAKPIAKPPPSKIAMRLSAALGGQLPDSWLHNQELSQLIGNRDFQEVCDIMVGIGMGKLQEPEKFFENFDQHLLAEQRAESDLKALFLKATASVSPTHNHPGGNRLQAFIGVASEACRIGPSA